MFGKILRGLRERKGESRKELANAIGVSLSTISNYENSIRKPDSDIIWAKIASHYNVSIDYLMGVESTYTPLNKSTPAPVDSSSINEQDDILSILQTKYNLSNAAISIVKSFSKMSLEDQDKFIELASKMSTAI